jgi:cytochrome P450
VLLADPDAIGRVLVDNADNYRKGEFQRRELEGLLGDGLLISEGESWQSARRAIQPAFDPGRIADHASTIVDCADDRIGEWEAGETVDLLDATGEITLTVLGEALFDTDLRDATAVREAARAVTDRFSPRGSLPFHVPDWVPLPSNLRYRRAVDRLDGFVERLVAERRAGAGEASDRSDLLSVLLAAGMDDTEVRDHLVTFLLAGHETTALALTYTLHCLATHPDEQAAVAEEVAALDGRPGMGDSLPRTDRAIREAMRRYPPVHLVMREAVEDDAVGGYHVPAGGLVLCSQWATHCRLDLWDDPESFRPSR